MDHDAAPVPAGTVGELSLPAAASSAPQARRFVRVALRGTRLEERADDAALAVSELVTNAVLHGKEPIVVTVRVTDSEIPEVRVEVRDGSPLSPAFSMLDPTALTGRGLLLVHAVAERWGVDPDEAGKVVWFTIRPGTEAAGDEDESTRLLLAWADDLDLDPADEQVRVVLTDCVTADLAASEAHSEGVLRELMLAARDEDGPLQPEAARLLGETAPLEALRAEVRRQVAAALHHRHPRVDVTLTVRREDADQVRDFLHAMDEADRLARRGGLLVPSASIDVTQTRRAFLRRLLDQLRS